MKKIILFLIVVFACVSCSSEYKKHDLNENRVVYKIGEGYRSFSLEYIDFNNHRYIKYADGYRGSLTHDPDCPYCKDNDN